jgi:hypothetical protein
VARANGTRTADAAVHKAQAAAEGVSLTGTVTFRGRQFRLGPCDAVAPMLDFAEAASRGLDSDDPAGLAAMKDMIRGCFVLHPACGTCEQCEAENYDSCPEADPGDWPRFWRLARATGADAEELMEVVTAATEQALARPTRARSGSSSPARRPSANSKALSSLPPAFQELADKGDLIAVDDVLR